MKILMLGLAVMALVWAGQAQAAEETWQKDIKPIFDKTVCWLPWRGLSWNVKRWSDISKEELSAIKAKY